MPSFHIAVPVLRGRTAIEAYSDLLASFAREFAPLLCSVICDVDIGLGPKGELRYPSTPPDSRWTFPGIGEFQVRLLVVCPCEVGHRVCAASKVASVPHRRHWVSYCYVC